MTHEVTHEELAAQGRTILTTMEAGFERNAEDHTAMRVKQHEFQTALDGQGRDPGLRGRMLLVETAVAGWRRLQWMFVAAIVGITVQIIVGAAVLLINLNRG
jgi:hypothetical protein